MNMTSHNYSTKLFLLCSRVSCWIIKSGTFPNPLCLKYSPNWDSCFFVKTLVKRYSYALNVRVNRLCLVFYIETSWESQCCHTNKFVPWSLYESLNMVCCLWNGAFYLAWAIIQGSRSRQTRFEVWEMSAGGAGSRIRRASSFFYCYFVGSLRRNE
jgi:hypothetical protein